MQSTSNVTHLPTAPAPSAKPRSWLRRILRGGQIIETCPLWCEDTHANDQDTHLDDLGHGTAEVTAHLTMPNFDGDGEAVAVPLLSARIQVDPYSEDPKRNVPFVSFWPWNDEVMDELTPEEFGALIAQIRAHCDRLDAVYERAVAARAEYGVRVDA